MEHRRLVVVGASFAGLACARAAAARGVSTTVIDEKKEAGSGIRTTGILVKEAADLLDVPQHLVRKLSKVRLYAPSLTHIDLERPGYSFLATDTPNLMRWLAREAERRGVEFRWNTPFRGLSRQARGAMTLSGTDLRCRFLVGADGARSVVARDIGAQRNTRFLSGIEAECRVVRGIDDDRLHVFLDSKLAPGYIGWIVPGIGATQIGLAAKLPTRPDLRGFIERIGAVFDLDSLEVTGHRSGLIPIGGPLRQNPDKPFLLIGDAAGWVSPLTAGGIHFALQLGRAAGIAAAEYLLDGGPHPLITLANQVPSLRFKRRLRALYDLVPADRLFNLLIDRPTLRRLAKMVFFHHRGLFSREAWLETLSPNRVGSR